VINYLYDLPSFKNQTGFVAKALGGWQISGVTQFQTGTPCGVYASTDFAGSGLDTNLGNAGCPNFSGQYMVVNGDPTIFGQFAANGSTDPRRGIQLHQPSELGRSDRPWRLVRCQQRELRESNDQGWESWRRGAKSSAFAPVLFLTRRTAIRAALKLRLFTTD